MSTKQLRLEVAQLTDVGRKREHNEDNMAYVIPKDQQVMAKKGALFIVADGMGGHAAGEVASEIAVDTISNVYYQDDGDDIANSLLFAIKRANALIHQRASENMLRSGMGTTCVAAVVRGNMAYVANVGDSRAYLVRNGQAKQVSQDHSWVAEQVRAGLLTEDQARTHAQRNVITRCLGTQADVEIDVFPEQIEDKDALVLCTDGLSGLVSDDEIRRIIDQSGPQDSVYHLVQRANENGGPDNITAIVVSIQEAGLESPNIRRPVPVGGREFGEDTSIPGLPSGSLVSTPAAIIGDGRIPGNSLRYSSGPLSPESIDTAPQPALYSRPRSRSRLFYPVLALLALLLLATAGGGIYFYLQSKIGTDVTNHMRDAQVSIDKANKEASTNPAAALHDLATVQNTLHNLLQNTSSTSTQHTAIFNLLNGGLTKSVQLAIVNYNKQSAITLLCPSNTAAHPINDGSTGTQAKTIALITGNNKLNLYTLGADDKLYLVSDNSLLSSSLPSSFTANTKILDIASNGSQLVLLTAQLVKADTATSISSYTLSLLSPDPVKAERLVLVASTQINAKQIQAGQIPTLIAAFGSDVYLVLGSNTLQTENSILDFSPKGNKPLAQSTESMFSSSDAIMSVTAFPNHQLFFLHAGGSVKSLQLLAGSNNLSETSVLVDNPIAQPLPVDAQFLWQTPVPTVTQGGTKSLAVPGIASSSALAVGMAKGEPHLYIMDTALHRVLDLKTSGGGSAGTPTTGVTPTSTITGGGVADNNSSVILQLAQQYVSPKLLLQPKSMAVDAQGSLIDVLSQNTASMYALISFPTNPHNTCA